MRLLLLALATSFSAVALLSSASNSDNLDASLNAREQTNDSLDASCDSTVEPVSVHQVRRGETNAELSERGSVSSFDALLKVASDESMKLRGAEQLQVPELVTEWPSASKLARSKLSRTPRKDVDALVRQLKLNDATRSHQPSRLPGSAQLVPTPQYPSLVSRVQGSPAYLSFSNAEKRLRLSLRTGDRQLSVPARVVSETHASKARDADDERRPSSVSRHPNSTSTTVKAKNEAEAAIVQPETPEVQRVRPTSSTLATPSSNVLPRSSSDKKWTFTYRRRPKLAVKLPEPAEATISRAPDGPAEAASARPSAQSVARGGVQLGTGKRKSAHDPELEFKDNEPSTSDTTNQSSAEQGSDYAPGSKGAERDTPAAASTNASTPTKKHKRIRIPWTPQQRELYKKNRQKKWDAIRNKATSSGAPRRARLDARAQVERQQAIWRKAQKRMRTYR